MNLENKVMQIIKENCEKKIDLKVDTDLIEEAGIDSFGILMIIGALEDEFNIQIDETQFRDLRTVTEISAQLKQKVPHLNA